ncbi:MAG: EAL domain-containing protein [Burkholderiales bacterium]|nr:EAL domain-containing protein [Burkholderiales bacterium]MDE2565924.1 EAL domain-containing protein [Burkholderiales bacterium]
MDRPASVEELAALRDEVAQFRLLANNLPAAIAYYDRQGYTCRYANLGYARMFGHTEASILGLGFARIIGEEAAREVLPRIDAVVSDRRRSSYERQLPGPDGRPRWIEVDVLPHLDAAGEVVGAFVLVHDITRHRQAEAALRQSEERLAKFMLASAEGIAFHKDGEITDVNPPLLALTGYALPELLGRQALDFVDPAERERVAAVMASGAEIGYETALTHKSGHRLPVEFIVRTLHYRDERLRMTIVRDLRDRIQARSRIDYLAHHDALTGLPNRSAFIERAQALLAAAQAQGHRPAMLFIDLDNFKRVNDSLGHLAGDTLLRTAARRITGALRSGDLVARFGGDEFVVLLSGDSRGGGVAEVAGKLLAAIGEPLRAGGATISVTPSIGVALFPEHGTDSDELIKHADTAMYQAKSRGRANCCIFEPAMAAAAMADLAMEGRLAQAVREREFVLHYQPQFALADGRLLGAEALIRWAPPGRPQVLPEDFIPLAEARRLMLPIGQWVLAEALCAARRWHDEGRPLPVAVNLSSLEFGAPDFVEQVQAALAAAGLPGRLLELELTERMLMDDLPAVRRTLLRLKALGVGIAVDDFGTGYTSLRHLMELPIDRLKLDRSFVQGLPGDAGAAAIVRAVIQMAQGLGMRTLAEGVETAAQQDWLRAQGCDEMQGEMAAPPMGEEALQAWLRARGA